MRRRKWLVVMWLFAIVALTGGTAYSQDDGTSGTGSASGAADEQLEALNKQKELLKAQIELAENEKKLVEAKYGEPAEPLDGDVSVKGDTAIESRVLAYAALDGVAEDMAGEILQIENGEKKAVIWDREQIDTLLFYQAFAEQLNLVQSDYERMLGDDPTFLSVAAVTAALSGVIDVLALFRTDREITSKDLEISELALVASLGGRLSAGDWKIYYPGKLPPDLAKTKASSLLAVISKLDEFKKEADKQLAPLKKAKTDRTKLKSQIAALTAKISKEKDPAVKKKIEGEKKTKEKELSSLEERIAELELVVGPLAKTNGTYEALRATLLAVDKDKGISKLARLLQAERLADVLSADTYVLIVAVLEAGGTTATSKNLFTGGRLRHSGGALASFILFDGSGAIARSGTYAGHGGQRRFTKW